MKKIFFFSKNKDKIKEVKNLLKNYRIFVLSINDLDVLKEPEENGRSFAENAKIKSDYGFNNTNIPCFADDSGICIEALKGKPGVLSKRYFNKFKSEKECLLNIVKLVESNGNNKAYFKTSICLTLKNSFSISFEGKIKGKITEDILGSSGFGYDPIFMPDGYKETFAQMTLRKKNLISHRSIAIKKLINFLIN